MRRPKGSDHPENRRHRSWRITAVLVALHDYLAVCAAYILALLLRFDGELSAIPQRYTRHYLAVIFYVAAFTVLLFVLLRAYRSMWKYASMKDVVRIIVGSLVSSGAHSLVISLMYVRRMPLSYHIIGAGIQLALLLGNRFLLRLLYSLHRHSSGGSSPKRVMLIGAGNAGQMILRDMNRASEINDRVVCFIDDDRNKWGRYLEGVPIVGGRDEILAAVSRWKVDKIFLAIPSATVQEKRDILNICAETGCELQQLPGMFQFMLGQISVSDMKKVSVEDLLGREPIQADMEEVYAFINGKTVLVTGGGGSIGSELCRQIAAHEPKQLIIFDIYENNAYAIQLELKEKYPSLNLEVMIGSVRDSRRIFKVFATYRPQIVYHAAAHKHVPLMEDSPCEAVKNNAIGTYKTAYAAMVHGCERFVLISTDKAVNPTNIMGASKRLCEMIIQSFDKRIKENRVADIPQIFTHRGEENADRDGTGRVFEGVRTEFVAVRFGNVLGSNGSVIPIFRRQIEKGGPVTVTHPDIIRYFMTIPEAVSLVMLAGTYAKGGEIFVLDMGSPVRIDTLARNLIRLSGFRPDIDIPIAYTGLRPGEKLYEEKLMAEEGLQKTENDLIFIGNPIPFDETEFLRKLGNLAEAAYDNDDEHIRSLVMDVVSTYQPEKGGPEGATAPTDSGAA